MLKLQPRSGVELRIAIEPPTGTAPAQAWALLFAGGSGNLQLDDSGKPSQIAGNFLIRSRDHLRTRGIGVVMVDRVSDADTQGMRFRFAKEHVVDVGVVVETIRQRFARPVWLIGTSAGSVSVALVTTRLGPTQRPAGIVLTSSVVSWRGSGYTSLFDYPLSTFSGPVLVVAHQSDSCEASLPSQAPRLLAAYTTAQPKKLIVMSGGDLPRSGPCDAFSPHGFIGVEEKTMAAIAEFILRPAN